MPTASRLPARPCLSLLFAAAGLASLAACGGGSDGGSGPSAPATYVVSGAVSGLSGSGLVLLANAADLSIGANGAFTISSAVSSGTAYTVTVKTQPVNPSQTCVVSNGSGVVTTANISDIAVNCSTNSYTISGTTSGLVGSGLVLQASGKDVAITSNGAFTISPATLSGMPYAVTIKTQPTAPNQTCVVANGSGTVTSSNIGNVGVTCTTNTYTIGGTISGLAGTGLVLQNNGGNDLAIAASGSFRFAAAALPGSAYAVSVKTAPTSPIQACTVANASGVVANADITNISVSCTTSLPVITTPPASVTVHETQSATFSVTATDANGPIRYQWTRNGATLQGATSSTWTLAAATLANNADSIAVVVSGNGGSVTSTAATLTVLSAAPRILTPPTAQSVVAGSIATFTVTATGLPTLAYQWLRNGSPIAGATMASHSFTATIADNGATYSVVVTNAAASTTSPAAALAVLPTSPSDLKITEVSYCYYASTACWFEIYNPTSSSLNLNAYLARTTTCYVGGCASVGLLSFPLPDFVLPPDSHVIVSGNTTGVTSTSSQNILIGNGSTVPYWRGSYGSIELLRNGSTVDYVALATSPSIPPAPSGPSGWSGSAVSAMAEGNGTTYGTAIVRSYPGYADTNTAADWVFVNFPTPAGRNDVPATAADSDQDGIPDSAEIPGGTFAGLDLYAMGARTSQKDIFIEVDQMSSSDPGVIPRREALQKVIDAFATRGIELHFDAGTTFSTTYSPADLNLGQGPALVPFEKCVTFDQTTCSANLTYRRSVYDWKNSFMDLRRRQVFHYLLFAYTQLNDGAARGSSGRAELPGNDLTITLGNWGLTTTAGSPVNRLINFQAGAIMHELGHNLGLNHGGDEDTNYKPNYLSVMNYMYTLNGLESDPKSATAYQRWRHEKGDGSPAQCSLTNSPCNDPSAFLIGYSDGTSSALNETSLYESQNLGRGSNAGAYADWNLNGTLTTGAQSRDLNADGALGALHDFDDWGHLTLSFGRLANGNAGPSQAQTVSRRIDFASNDHQAVADEPRHSDRLYRSMDR